MRERQHVFFPIFPVVPAGPGPDREVQPITPGILGAYYLAGEKKIR
jgi:hypothetical protein